MATLINEQIKAYEVLLTGLNGEKLGIFTREEAIKLARAQGVDLVCMSLMSSPPPCCFVAKGKGKEILQKQTISNKELEIKELRFTAQIEDHDYETKLRQADKLLRSGKAVLLVVKASGSKEASIAKTLLEQLVTDLKEVGSKNSGIQSGGKGSQVQLNPK